MRSWLKPDTTKQMSEASAAWLAGFIDGEGSIVSHFAGRKRQYKCWFIVVPNTNLAALEFCKFVTGVGSIYPRKRPKVSRHKPQWQWKVESQRNIRSILRQIRPYLVIKNGAADVFLSEWRDIGSVAQRSAAAAS